MNKVAWQEKKLRIGNRVVQLPHPVVAGLVIGNVVAVLYDPESTSEKFGVFENLVGIGSNGEHVWTAPVPTSSTGDCFIAIGEELGQIVATSWSGWRVRLDPISGKIIDREFIR